MVKLRDPCPSYQTTRGATPFLHSFIPDHTRQSRAFNQNTRAILIALGLSCSKTSRGARLATSRATSIRAPGRATAGACATSVGAREMTGRRRAPTAATRDGGATRGARREEICGAVRAARGEDIVRARIRGAAYVRRRRRWRKRIGEGGGGVSDRLAPHARRRPPLPHHRRHARE